MFVVMNIEFDAELHSVWGPFKQLSDALAWLAVQPDRDELVVRQIAPATREQV